jgi:transposase InsO family protein
MDTWRLEPEIPEEAAPSGKQVHEAVRQESKRDAIALVGSSGKTVTTVARDLGISSESLRGWYRKAGTDRGESEAARRARQAADDWLAHEITVLHLASGNRFRGRIRGLGPRQSCGRTGSCFDNAAAESLEACSRRRSAPESGPTGPPPAPTSSPSSRPPTTVACANTRSSATSPRPGPGIGVNTPSRHNHRVSEITGKLQPSPSPERRRLRLGGHADSTPRKSSQTPKADSACPPIRRWTVVAQGGDAGEFWFRLGFC